MSTAQQNKIGLFSATIIGINAMIGAGIFAMPAFLAEAVGPAAIISFLLSSIVILSIVFPLGRLAQLHPGESWGYAYPAQWGGHYLGLLSSFSYLIGVIVAMGFLTQQMGVWIAPFVNLSAQTLGVGMLVVLIGLVLAGTEISSFGQYVIAGGVIIPLIITSVVCWFHFNPELVTPFFPQGKAAVLSAMPKVLFALLGFESIASLYSIVDKPEKNVPLAAVLAVITVVSAYTLFVSSALFSIHYAYFFNGVNSSFSQVLTHALPHLWWVKYIVTTGAFFAIAGTLHSMIWSIAALCRDTLAHVRADVIQSALKTGRLSLSVCVCIVGALTLFAAIILPVEAIMAWVPILIVSAYMWALIALLFKKEEWQSYFNLVTLCALASCSALLVLSVQNLLSTF